MPRGCREHVSPFNRTLIEGSSQSVIHKAAPSAGFMQTDWGLLLAYLIDNPLQ